MFRAIGLMHDGLRRVVAPFVDTKVKDTDPSPTVTSATWDDAHMFAEAVIALLTQTDLLPWR